MQGISFEQLMADGFVRLNENRDWRPFADGFPTPNGKAQLWSDSMQQRGLDPLPSPGQIRTGSSSQLQLITSKTLFFLNSSYAHVERHCRREGTLYVEIHSDDALTRQVHEGDLVQVANEYGSVIAICRISDRVRPGVVWMPFGGWGDAAGQPYSANSLTPVEPTDWGGGSGFYDACVDVSPYDGPNANLLK
jgi:anaerobic selenocysteine-containing dehydrogenase